VEVLYASIKNLVHRGGSVDAFLRIDAIESLLQRSPIDEPPVSFASLWEVAHSAAFLTDDAHRMSRYYTRLLPLSNTLTRSRARELWVTRCFAHLWIPGAWRIGTLVLADLGAIPDTTVGWESLRKKHGAASIEDSCDDYLDTFGPRRNKPSRPESAVAKPMKLSVVSPYASYYQHSQSIHDVRSRWRG
jgi:hypothetical protein